MQIPKEAFWGEEGGHVPGRSSTTQEGLSPPPPWLAGALLAWRDPAERYEVSVSSDRDPHTQGGRRDASAGENKFKQSLSGGQDSPHSVCIIVKHASGDHVL